MKSKKAKFPFLAVSFIFFIILTFGIFIFQFFSIETLKNELADANEQLSTLQETAALQNTHFSELEKEQENTKQELDSRINSLSAELNNTRNMLEYLQANFTSFEEEYISLQEDYENLQVNYAEKEQEYVALMGEIEDFEQTLEEKMFWYTANSDFDNSGERFLRKVRINCIDGSSLNMPCLYTMLEDLDYEYISEKGDMIKSLEQFEKAKGGDCEDWALFVKAMVNHFENEEGVKKLRIMNREEEGHFTIYIKDNVEYFYPYDSMIVDIEDLRVACFSISEYEGHCVLVSDNILFEPRGGYFLNEVQMEGNEYIIDEGGYIDVLINNEDIYVATEEGWISYAFFIEKLQSITGNSE
ncbi:hypothetical protein KAW38_02545 [Candidatus Micrarchaeota archaeon]|nr:hypothetical protein [Candidatus Micrarchaeota archaeon]